MHVLDDILASLRFSGGVVFDAVTHGDWCLVSQFRPEDCAPYFPVPGRIISYHYVRKGVLYTQIPGQEVVELREGSMVMFPRNDVHHLFTRPGQTPTDIAQYVTPGAGGALNAIAMDFGGEEASLFCGWLGVINGAHPLLDALPPLLLVKRDDYAADWIASSLSVAARDWSSSPAMVAKISELFFAQAARRYADSFGEGQGGWLAGLRDPAVARALSVIHARYADDLDVDTLAREAGVSRTVLGERFGRLLGEPPMRYCARWRMQVAVSRLLDGDGAAAAIAPDIGFSSEAAFNRAFKREYGEPPAAWKRRVDAETDLARVAHAADA
ncbi:AraC family transcriptional regulator [Phenylobacterium sp.]|uniref:helix-turn-helix domain-containing protein n=1 Tax=Phenylobacterium sp. TaxID=1871053 RepID=UPI0027366DA5|nr:AraC family transcriptional regulator [Phenylobacterium sp.]MDP3658498.1 AraC family transcriptional regulator [Phenylobacterium sp.]